ncbi:MAG TPA: phosphoribosyltransferase family protein [Solirubrobacterales bacterium]|nr:phosphoribosyltransferase family protein [Solirubrobacterales bacterium]
MSGRRHSRLALFEDRRDAGRQLAQALLRFRGSDPLILALPRGGVPVGFEVAAALGAPLDVVLVRKIGAPFQPEFGIGAIAEGGIRFIRVEDVEMIGVSESELDEIVARESQELERRARAYRGELEPLPVEGRTAIVVDDGVATGGTAVAAARALRARGAGRVILAVPVAPPGTAGRLGDEFDEVICLEEPHGFFGIGQFYVSFGQLGDQDVIDLLSAAQAPAAAGGSDAGDPPAVEERAVEIEAGPDLVLHGDLRMPAAPAGLVIFAHGSGSSRLSPRNREVAAALNEAGMATLLFDLLSDAEAASRTNVFDIDLLSARLVAVTRWASERPDLSGLPLGYFGASTGAAAARCGAAELGERIGAVVSRGGRPDLAAPRLGEVSAPTLLIVGGADWQVLELNERAAEQLRCEHETAIVPGATHLFEEPGALERVAALAGDWFRRCLA